MASCLLFCRRAVDMAHLLILSPSIFDCPHLSTFNVMREEANIWTKITDVLIFGGACEWSVTQIYLEGHKASKTKIYFEAHAKKARPKWDCKNLRKLILLLWNDLDNNKLQSPIKYWYCAAELQIYIYRVSQKKCNIAIFRLDLF